MSIAMAVCVRKQRKDVVEEIYTDEIGVRAVVSRYCMCMFSPSEG